MHPFGVATDQCLAPGKPPVMMGEWVDSQFWWWILWELNDCSPLTTNSRWGLLTVGGIFGEGFGSSDRNLHRLLPRLPWGLIDAAHWIYPTVVHIWQCLFGFYLWDLILCEFVGVTFVLHYSLHMHSAYVYKPAPIISEVFVGYLAVDAFLTMISRFWLIIIRGFDSWLIIENQY